MKEKKIAISVFSLVLCLLVAFSGCLAVVNKGKTETTFASEENNAEDFGTGITKENSDGTMQSEKQPSKYPAGEKLIALTYDDGPYEKTTSAIIDILRENNAAATFFIVGNRVNSSTAKVLKDAVDIGCEIANHTHAHKNLTAISNSELNSQINDANNAVSKYVGVTPKLLRAPGGKFDGIKDKVPMPLIQWSIDTEDWRNKDSSNQSRTPEERQAKIEEIIAEILSGVKPGDIILMHDIYDFTVDLSRYLIPELVKQGYRLATVSDMFDYYGVELEAGGVYRYARPSTAVTEEKVPLEPGIYVVNAGSESSLNMRDKAGTDGAVITEIPNGVTVVVLQSSGGWSNVTYEGNTGWVSSNYLKPYQAVS